VNNLLFDFSSGVQGTSFPDPLGRSPQLKVVSSKFYAFFGSNSHTDRIPNAEVMQRMKVSEMCLYKSIQKQKMAFAGHVLQGSSGENALLLLESKMDAHVAQGRPRCMWIDDIKNWTKLDTYEKIKRTAADRLK